MMGRATGLWAGRPWDCGLSGATGLWAVRGHAVCSRYYHTGVGGINRWRQQHLSPRQCCYL